MLVAAVVVVASQWNLIPQSVRFCGLLAAFVAIVAIAERIRATAPTTATVVAHLVPGIAVTVGIAAGATLGNPWPVSMLIGGLLGASVSEVNVRRWRAPRMAVITACSAVVAAVGLAGQTSAPIAVIAGIVAVALLLLRRELEAATIAVLVGASPVLGTLTTFKVGDGTMTRIGAAGHVLIWAAPIAGALAGVVLGVLAHRRRSVGLVIASSTSLLLNVVAGLAVEQASTPAWATLIAAALLATELSTWLRSDSVWTTSMSHLSNGVATAMSGTVPVIAAAAFAGVTFAPAVSLAGWSIPIALTLATTTSISVRRTGASSLAAIGAVALIVCLASSLGASPLVVSLVGLAVLAASATTRLVPAESAAAASGVALAVTLLRRAIDRGQFSGIDHWTTAAAIDLALVLCGAVLSMLVLARRSSTSDRAMLLAVAGAALSAGVVTPMWAVAMATIIGVVVGLVGVLRRPAFAAPLALAAVGVSATHMGGRHWSNVVAIVVCAVPVLVARRATVHALWSAQVVLAATVLLQINHVAPTGITGSLIAAAIALSGIAFTTSRFTALDSGAIAAAGLAIACSVHPDSHPAFISLSVLVASAQGLGYGVARSNRPLAGWSAITGGASLFSLWFTSGTNAALLSGLARYDFRRADLAVLAISAVMLIIGAGVRRWNTLNPVSTWLAYGPALAVLTSWLLVVQVERRADWASIIGLVVGIACIAVGGWRRLAAPLVIGTASLIATTIAATGSQLASLPGWAWLVVGGTALLVLAVAVERHSNDDDAAGLSTMLRRYR